MEIKNYWFIIKAPDYNWSKDKASLNSKSFSSTIIAVSSIEEAYNAADELIASWVDIIELCWWFEKEWYEKIKLHTKSKVPIGYVIFDKMRKIHRTIASALIFSKDNKLLLWKKDPNAGWVYPDCWHLPGGGLNEGETIQEAVIREVKEEVGIDITDHELTPLPFSDSGTSEKTLKNTWEKVLCHMKFNRFEIHLEENAEDIKYHLSDDLVEIHWFPKIEISNLKQPPGGKEFFQKMGYIK